MGWVSNSYGAAILGLTLTACRGHSHVNGRTGGTDPDVVEAGGGGSGDGDTGAEAGAAGAGLVATGAVGGMAHGGAGGAGTAGGGHDAASGGKPAASAGSNGGGATGGGGVGGAGAPSAGTSSSAGAGGAPPIVAPAQCQSTSQSADATTCNYVYSCGGQTHFDDCSLGSGGVWSCDCGTFSTDTRYFEIEGVGALDACATIARVCESGDLSLSSARTCRPLERTKDASTCSAHDTCGSEVNIDLPSGVVVRAVDHYRASCKPTQAIYVTDLQFRCSCQGVEANGFGSLTTAPSTDELCDRFIQFCRSDQNPAYTDRVCGYTAPSGNVLQSCPMNPSCQGCSIGQDCAMSAPLGGGVSLVDDSGGTEHRIDCIPQNGTLRCVCDSKAYLYGDDSVPQSILDVCSGALDVCRP